MYVLKKKKKKRRQINVFYIIYLRVFYDKMNVQFKSHFKERF